MDQNTIWIIVVVGFAVLLFLILNHTVTQKEPVSKTEDQQELMNNGEVVLAQVQEVKPKTQNGTDYFVTARWQHPQSKKMHTAITNPGFPNYPFPTDLKPFEIGSYLVVHYDKNDPTRYYVNEFYFQPLIIGDITLNSKGGVRNLEDVLKLHQKGMQSEARVADVQAQTSNGKTYYYINAFWRDPSTNEIKNITSGAFPSSPLVRRGIKITVKIDPNDSTRYFVSLYPQP